MPNNANTNSANRRRRRANLLRQNDNLFSNIVRALRNVSNKYYTKRVTSKVRQTWPKNLVPYFNRVLMNRLRVAYENAKPNVLARRKANKEKQNAERQANRLRKKKQHEAFLQTNAGRQWKRKNNEEKARQAERQRQRNQYNRNMYARTGYSMYNFGGHGSGW